MATPLHKDDDEPLLVVVHTRYMDTDTFRKHMAFRHRASLHGRDGIGPFYDPYVERCWRAFHSTVHRLALYGDMDHEHGE